MAAASISRWARRYLLTGIAFLFASQVAAVATSDSHLPVRLGLLGFVCLVAFGKAYSLLPSYFDRTLAWPRAPAVHLPLAVLGVLGLGLARVSVLPTRLLVTVGAVAWAAGVAVFLGTLVATVRDNPLGAETGTSDANEQRRGPDRLANAFMPVALAYLAAGSYELLAGAVGLPTLLGGAWVRAAHLLAAGFAAMLIFSVGFRLLPRFLVVDSPERLPLLVLPAGAIGPVLIAAGLYSGPLFVAGAVLEALAVVGFAAAYGSMFVRSERRRVGFWGPLLGALAGVLGVGLGLQFALDALQADLALLHRTLNVFGFLGLTIVGLLYQFYPPAVGDWPGAGDRLALATIAFLGGGVLLAGLGQLAGRPVGLFGTLLIALAALGIGYLLAAAMATRSGR
jgi:hypothetical protein